MKVSPVDMKYVTVRSISTTLSAAESVGTKKEQPAEGPTTSSKEEQYALLTQC